MTTYVISGGNLIAAVKSFNLINAFAHGANCWSAMGAGIAGIIAAEFPAIAQADSEDPRGPEQRLGSMSYAFDYDKGCWGFNLYTQFYPGPNARMPSVISSVQLMFEQIHEIVEAKPEETVYVGLPAIGCGIGGLNFFEVVRSIHSIAESVQQDTKRRVVPVFYVTETLKFAEDMNLLDSLDMDIQIVSSEDDVLKLEGAEVIGLQPKEFEKAQQIIKSKKSPGEKLRNLMSKDPGYDREF